ncbi:MAG: hypothetical protein D3925_00890 [Candidatus Electrothrix sp. AR5]|nr:hypothetical protein [Candidatus Electrothrix sp. AR5]
MTKQYQISPDKVRENNHNRLHSSIKIYEFEEARGHGIRMTFAINSTKYCFPATVSGDGGLFV